MGRTEVERGPPLDLEALPGVGPALARRIRAAYGSDATFLEACARLDLDALLHGEGLSERRAFEIVAAVRRGHAPDLAVTERGRDVRRDLEDLLASYARTPYGQRSLRLLPVLRDPAAIEARTQHVLALRDTIERLDRVAIGRALSRLDRLREPARASLRRLVICENEADEMTLRSRGVDRWCRIAHGERAVREAADYEVAVYAANEETLPVGDLPHVVSLPINAPLWKIVPETETGFVAANRSVISALQELAMLLDRTTAATRVLEAADGVAPDARVDVAQAADAALAAAQADFRERVARLSLDGEQILELLGSATPRALVEARTEAVAAGRRAFRAATGRDIDPFAPGLPLRLDEEDVVRLRRELEAEGASAAFLQAQRAAQVVHEARETLRQELAAWLRFDVDFALASYALDHSAVAARTSRRFSFQAARNLRLARKGGATPISYELGGEYPVAVLTGANSGGKSSLLELCAQLVLLHHWGLPVPVVEAEIPILDELLVFGHSRALDAGALETFLRELFPPLTRPGRKLVLLDEVESMTELDAAGKILGVFLDEVGRSESLCLLVTHLPDEVLRHARVRVRLDGIDAVGLDEQFNLIVDRQPKLGHRARSTPELILRRVHARSEGRVRDLFGAILNRWDERR
jgi:DNA mismatch repair protein MutS2